jgi:hypothetical protein
VACDVPSWTEDEEICQGRAGGFGLGGEDAEDGGVDVVLGDATDVHEFLQSVFVGYIVSVPCDHVERSMLLLADMQLPSDSVVSVCAEYHRPKTRKLGCAYLYITRAMNKIHVRNEEVTREKKERRKATFPRTLIDVKAR